MKKKILVFLCILFGSIVFAQSADTVTKILNSENATFGQACYLSAVYQDLVNDKASYNDSINALYNKNQIFQKFDTNEKITYQELAGIFIKMFPSNNDSLMYNIFGSDRYALKLLKNQGIIPSYVDADDYLTGREMMNILSNCIFILGSQDDCIEMDLGE